MNPTERTVARLAIENTLLRDALDQAAAQIEALTTRATDAEALLGLFVTPPVSPAPGS